MALPPDNDVVVDIHAHQAGSFDDLLRHLNVGAAGLGAAGGMVVDQDHRCRAHVQPLLHHFAGIDRAFVERAVSDQMIEDQHVLGVQLKTIVRMLKMHALLRFWRVDVTEGLPGPAVGLWCRNAGHRCCSKDTTKCEAL